MQYKKDLVVDEDGIPKYCEDMCIFYYTLKNYDREHSTHCPVEMCDLAIKIYCEDAGLEYPKRIKNLIDNYKL